MTPEQRLSATSFLLGRAMGGMMFIIINEMSAKDKVEHLIQLQIEIREEIDKLFYTTRDPSAKE